jgi:protoporphyrinogen oxidase
MTDLETKTAGATIILGAGMSGLGAALSSGAPAYEATNRPGGVCYSYYVDQGGRRRDPSSTAGAGECFRFEPAGGHWLFGVSAASLQRLERYGQFRQYHRKAAVFFPHDGTFVPYPLQDNLRSFAPGLRDRVLAEIRDERPPTMTTSPSFKDWLLDAFGPTLCELFFFPFHERYTAGLYTEIAPQDLYKTAVQRDRVVRGAFGPTEDSGYNQIFYYPDGGLDRLVRAMSAACDIRVDHRVISIDTRSRVAHFENGAVAAYDGIISTIPLDRALRLCGITCLAPPNPATAVLVVNVGAMRGRRCPPWHWLYLPVSRSGMHRVGFYSHVDRAFLPSRFQARDDVVSIYAERSFPAGSPPGAAALAAAATAMVEELADWGFIAETMAVDWTYTDPAYTWARPGSRWVDEAVHRLGQQGVRSIGRYGAWRFQGMMESFEQGVAAAGGLFQ